MTVVEFSVKSS